MSGVIRKCAQFLDESLALLFQPTCLICETLTGPANLCSRCQPIYYLGNPQCGRCGAVLSQTMDRCGECLIDKSSALEKTRSLLWFVEGARSIVHKVKYGGRFELLEIFRESVRDGFDVFFPLDAVIVPIPIHFSKLKERGFNQSLILGRWLQKESGLGFDPLGLRKLRPSISQATLSENERRDNLKGSFGWKTQSSAPRCVLLVDDVYTTGATLEACARVLKRAGAEEVYGWTLFRAPKWGTGFALPTREVSS